MKWFNNPKTLEELKAQYRKLALANHPDRGGNVEDMKAINAEYERLFGELKDIHVNKDGEFYHKETHEAPGEFVDIIERLIGMSGITIELCGSWLWVTGDTRPHKDRLKEVGFRWSPNKSAWYFHHGAYKKMGKRKMSMDDIRSFYGSEEVTAESRKKQIV